MAVCVAAAFFAAASSGSRRTNSLYSRTVLAECRSCSPVGPLSVPKASERDRNVLPGGDGLDLGTQGGPDGDEVPVPELRVQLVRAVEDDGLGGRGARLLLLPLRREGRRGQLRSASIQSSLSIGGGSRRGRRGRRGRDRWRCRRTRL